MNINNLERVRLCCRNFLTFLIWLPNVLLNSANFLGKEIWKIVKLQFCTSEAVFTCELCSSCSEKSHKIPKKTLVME